VEDSRRALELLLLLLLLLLPLLHLVSSFRGCVDCHWFPTLQPSYNDKDLDLITFQRNLLNTSFMAIISSRNWI
jgi:hypothetical protein